MCTNVSFLHTMLHLYILVTFFHRHVTFLHRLVTLFDRDVALCRDNTLSYIIVMHMLQHKDDTILYKDDTFLHKDETFLHKDDTCELNISCTSTAAESRAKVWYQ